MKKRLMSTLLMGAFFIASTSMFVSCKDYDDDINANTKAIQNVETSLKAQIADLKSALDQEKTTATAAHSNLESAIKAAQAAADAAKTDLAKAIADANSTHATKTELGALENVVSTKASQDALTLAIADLRSSLTTAISDGDASTAANAQAALNAAIEKVNAALEGVKGDIATVGNAQTEIKNTLTNAIKDVDTKAGQNASAIEALNTALAGVQQSMQTKEAVQNAIDIAKGEIATNIQAVQAAADKAQSDATSAKQDLATLAEKVSTYAAAQAAAETKIEALQKAIETAQALENELSKGIAANKENISVITNQIATLDAQIKSVNENLSKLIEANTNSIQDLAGTVGNIDLQVKALEKFCGNLDALNVAGIRDSMRLSFAELKAAKQEAAQNLAAAEVRAAETAAGYVAALNKVLTARVDSLRDNYATDEELAAASLAVTTLVTNYVDALNVPALQKTVDKMTEDLGVYTIADILENLEWVNNTLTWTEDGEIINLEAELNDIDLEFDAIGEWAEEIDKFVEATKNNVAGYQTSAEVQALIDAAIKDKDGKDKYVALNQLNALLADVAMAETYKAAGVAMKSDLNDYAKSSELDKYLLKADIDLTKVGASIGEAKAKEIAEKAIKDANLATKTELSDAVKAYDAQLAASLEKLFAAVQPVAEDANGAEEATKTAAEVIAEIAESFGSVNGVAPAVANELYLLRGELLASLTSLVFYPEIYYAGIEAIEITAMRIDTTYVMCKEYLNTALEGYAVRLPDEVGANNLYPQGYAKYHYNPANTDLKDYQLKFIDHFAATRSADEQTSYLQILDTNAENNVNPDGVEDDLLWVKFDNNKEIWENIWKVSRIPSLAHNAQGGSHYVYGNVYGKNAATVNGGIITALVATNETAEDETPIASDYAMIVPVEINKLILSSATHHNLINQREQEIKNHAYYCQENTNFHLYTNAMERIEDAWTGWKRPAADEDGYYEIPAYAPYVYKNVAVDLMMYNQEFDLDSLVETHFRNSASMYATDQLVDKSLFERLHLAYRYSPIQYTRGHNGTSESLFITLTESVGNGMYSGKGYFNRVTDLYDENGKIVKNKWGNGVGQKDVDKDGKPIPANRASVGRQPVVRVELYNTETKQIYAIGYLKLQIVEKIEREPVTFEAKTYGTLIANCDCDDDPETVTLTWDQIQAQLTKIGEDGMSPEDWNTYEVASAPSGYFAAQFFMNADGDLELIDKEYNYEEGYTNFYVGDFDLVDWTEYEGIHTKVLQWSFNCQDFQNLYYDAYVQGLDNYFEKDPAGNFTGVYTKPITRYIQLVSSNAALPVINIGVTLLGNSIYYAIGELGALKNAYWKDAASNKEGLYDMVVNVDIKSASGNTAVETNNLKAGIMKKNIVKNFYGEQIKLAVDVSNVPEKYQKYASEVFEGEAYTYSDAQFYFRYPGTTNSDARNALENKVIADGEWVVNGYSGNQYTLVITDLFNLDCNDNDGKKTNYKYLADYGKTVSILKINGLSIADYVKAYNAELEDDEEPISIPTVEKRYRVKGSGAVTKANVIPVMEINTANDIRLIEDTKESEFKGVDYSSRGFAQDMLNYANHDEGAGNSNARPYEKQLTAFIVLMAEDGSIVSGSGINRYVAQVYGGDDASSANGGMCYILPGAGQTKCAGCDGTATSTTDFCPRTTSVCYKPFVTNNTYAVRFYKPIKWTVSQLDVLRDAKLGDQLQKTVTLDKFSYQDWANYTPSTMTNFTTVYGIQTALYEVLDYTSDYYIKATPANAQTITEWAAENNKTVLTGLSADNQKLLGIDVNKNKSIAVPAEPTTSHPEDANGSKTTDAYGTYQTWVTAQGDPDILDVDVYFKKDTEAEGVETKFAVTDNYSSYYTGPTTDGGTDDKGYAKMKNAASQKISVDGTDYAYPTKDPGTEAAWVAAKNKTLDADHQIKSPGAEPTAVAHPGVVPTYLEYLKDQITLEEGQAWDQTEILWKYYQKASKDVLTEPTLTLEDGKYVVEENVKAPKAIAAGESDADVISIYNTYLTNYPKFLQTVNTYNTKLAAYNKYLDDLAKYNVKKAEYDAAIAEFTKAKAVWDAAQAEYNDIVKAQNDAKAEYTTAKTAFDNWINSNAKYTLWIANSEAVKKEAEAYNKYLADLAGANTTAENNQTAANKKLAQAAVKKVLRTDLGKPAAQRVTTLSASQVEALPTIAEAAPDDLDFTIDEITTDNTGKPIGFKYTYTNNNLSTNEAFHIWVPLQLKYYYADTKPCAPMVVWTYITVQSTQGNQNARIK